MPSKCTRTCAIPRAIWCDLRAGAQLLPQSSCRIDQHRAGAASCAVGKVDHCRCEKRSEQSALIRLPQRGFEPPRATTLGRQRSNVSQQRGDVDADGVAAMVVVPALLQRLSRRNAAGIGPLPARRGSPGRDIVEVQRSLLWSPAFDAVEMLGRDSSSGASAGGLWRGGPFVMRLSPGVSCIVFPAPRIALRGSVIN